MAGHQIQIDMVSVQFFQFGNVKASYDIQYFVKWCLHCCCCALVVTHRTPSSSATIAVFIGARPLRPCFVSLMHFHIFLPNFRFLGLLSSCYKPFVLCCLNCQPCLCMSLCKYVMIQSIACTKPFDVHFVSLLK